MLPLFVLLKVFCPAAQVTEFAEAFDVSHTSLCRTPYQLTVTVNEKPLADLLLDAGPMAVCLGMFQRRLT
ncbi:MAG: hypothetical protein HKL81_10485 [Acidimicrobiaceae bacterium]|nr:hypothetical protein [Acidimicrobiaceae bacterium]